MWFPGVHCDVGGGYPKESSGLSKLALEWMLAEAHDKGLRLDQPRTARVLGRDEQGYAKPDANAPMHNSLTWRWWLCEFMPKPNYTWTTHHREHRMNLFRRRTVPPGELVHDSVLRRTGYAPELPLDHKAVSTLPLPVPPLP